MIDPVAFTVLSSDAQAFEHVFWKAFTMSHSVSVELHYVLPKPEPLYLYTYEPLPHTPRTNMEPDPHVVAIEDVRASADELSLDRQGFSLIRHKSRIESVDPENQLAIGEYSLEAEALLQELTGADRVIVFDHTIRQRIPGTSDREAPRRQPVSRVHVDQTLESGPQRVRNLVPGEADRLLAGRVQIINLWRPLRWPVLDAPLAICDAGSVDATDLMPAAQIYRDRRGETYAVRFNPAHRWSYLSEMRPDEALLIKCYDSIDDGRARFTPHCAFVDPSAPPDAPPRHSIEVRALVCHAV